MYRSLRSISVIVGLAMAVAATVWGAVRTGFAIARSWIHDISPISIKQPKPKCRAALVQPKAFVTRLAQTRSPDRDGALAHVPVDVTIVAPEKGPPRAGFFMPSPLS